MKLDNIDRGIEQKFNSSTIKELLKGIEELLSTVKLFLGLKIVGCEKSLYFHKNFPKFNTWKNPCAYNEEPL